MGNYTKVIYKFEINEGKIILPGGAKFLKLGLQDNQLNLWFEVDRAQIETEVRRFNIIPTGYPFRAMPTDKYLDTFFDAEGLVFHVYEYISEPSAPAQEGDEK